MIMKEFYLFYYFKNMKNKLMLNTCNGINNYQCLRIILQPIRNFQVNFMNLSKVNKTHQTLFQ